MSALALTLAPYTPPEIAADVREASIGPQRARPLSVAQIQAQAKAFTRDLNDASHALLHGSESFARISPVGSRLGALIIAALLAFASPAFSYGPQQAIGDGILDRIDRRAERLEARLEASTREQGRIADFFERLSNREGKGLLDGWDGSRIANVFRGIYWMVMACIACVTVAAVALAAKQIGEAVRAWRGKA